LISLIEQNLADKKNGKLSFSSILELTCTLKPFILTLDCKSREILDFHLINESDGVFVLHQADFSDLSWVSPIWLADSGRGQRVTCWVMKLELMNE